MTTAQPGLAPHGQPSAGTMFAALYGDSSPHPWHGQDPEWDAYSLFYQRSLAMGWLKEQEEDASGVWSMNDAGWTHPLVPSEQQLAAWFQVEAEALPPGRPLPVQPFLRCAGDVASRSGTLNLRSVLLLLPLAGIDLTSQTSTALSPTPRTARWFESSDTAARHHVEVRMASGPDPSAPDALEHATQQLPQWIQDVFTRPSCEVTASAANLPLPFDDTFWDGPAEHAVNLRGEVSEWSLDAIGWLSEALASLAAHHGARAPLLLTMTRSQ